MVASWTEGSRERMAHVLSDHKLHNVINISSWRMLQAIPRNEVMLAILGIEQGFEPDPSHSSPSRTCSATAWCGRDVRRASCRISSPKSSSLSPGDLVTHVEHGIGRFSACKTIDVAGAPHDCLELQYDGGKLFLPVENIELLTRYGSEEAGVSSTGSAARGWQPRKARMKERVREIAGELIRIAAERQLREAPKPVDRRKAL